MLLRNVVGNVELRLAFRCVTLAEVTAEDECLDILLFDVQSLFLQPAVVGVQVAVLHGAPVMPVFADLRTLAPHVESPAGLCVQCLAHGTDAVS